MRTPESARIESIPEWSSANETARLEQLLYSDRAEERRSQGRENMEKTV